MIDVGVRRGANNVVGTPGALHPAVRAALDQMAALPRVETLTPDAARRLPAMFDPSPEPVVAVIQRWIPGPGGPLALRSYRPPTGPSAAFVYLHGGGFVTGSLEAADGLCRRLANATGCTVFSVDYRLAPETKFPGPVEDAYAALRWVDEEAASLGVAGRPLVVGGSSAGGSLAAAACLLARDRGAPGIAMQVLIVPTLWMAAETESMRAFGTGYGLDVATMEWFARQYLRTEEDAADPLASPYLAPDVGGLPPALVVTAEFDCLRDDGERYAERLRAAGIEATAIRYAGMIHGFMGLPVDAARLAVEHVGGIVRERLAELG